MKTIYRFASYKLICLLIFLSAAVMISAPQAFSKTSKSVDSLFNTKGKIIDISLPRNYIYMNDMGYRFTPKTLYYTSPQQPISIKEFQEGDKAGIILDPEDGTIKVMWLIKKK